MAVYIGNRKKVAIAIVGLVSLVLLWNSDIVEDTSIQTYIAARKFTTPALNTLATPSHHPTTKELSNTSSEFYGCGEWLKQCEKECSNGNGKIPRLIHFIKDKDFSFMDWWAVMAARKYIKPDRIYFYSKEELEGCWWRRASKYIQHVVLPEDQWVHSVNRIPVDRIEHQSDLLRNGILYHQGGIYMDTDAIATKSFDPLFDQHVVLSKNVLQEVGNGLLMVEKHSCFICHYGKKACENFSGLWVTHSVRTLTHLVHRKLARYNGLVVLGHNDGFYPLSWFDDDQKILFEKNAETVGFNTHKVFALHLFTSAYKDLKKRCLGNFTWLSESPSVAASAAREVLPIRFTPEDLDVKKCRLLN